MHLFELWDKKDYQIYCDLDGVLADFEGAFRKEFGRPTDTFSDDELWKRVGSFPNYFYKLDFLKPGIKLWAYVKKYDPVILTGAPASNPQKGLDYKKQKELWVKEKLGPYVKCIVCLSSEKQKYAKPNSILIDDRIRNINQWIAAGGIGIHYTDVMSSIKQLKDLGL